MPCHARLIVCVSIVVAGCGRLGFDNVMSNLSDGGDGTLDASDASSAFDAATDGAMNESDASLPPPLVFSDICRFTSGVIVKNGAVEDEVLGPPLGMALATHCQNGATFVEKSQDDPTVIDATTGRPLIGPTQVGVLIGGEYFGRAVQYLDMMDSPVAISESDNSFTATNRATGQVIRTWDLTQLTNSHDFAIVQVMREPMSDSFLVHEFGHLANGTHAGADYLARVIGPGLRSDTHTFYVVEWTDQNGDELPNDGDEFTLVASG